MLARDLKLLLQPGPSGCSSESAASKENQRVKIIPQAGIAQKETKRDVVGIHELLLGASQARQPLQPCSQQQQFRAAIWGFSLLLLEVLVKNIQSLP